MAASVRLTGPRTGLQNAALGTGIVFCLAGILGFIPGITSNHGSLGLAGHASEALLLGIFQVSVLHNAVHLLFGIAGILMSRSHPQARSFLVYGGVIYLVLWLYGLLVGDTTPANFMPANHADNWLHLVLGLVMIALAVMLARGPAAAAGNAPDEEAAPSLPRREPADPDPHFSTPAFSEEGRNRNKTPDPKEHHENPGSTRSHQHRFVRRPR